MPGVQSPCIQYPISCLDDLSQIAVGRNAYARPAIPGAQKLVAIGDDFWIENDSGERVYKVDGKPCACARPWSSKTPPETSCVRFRTHVADQGQHGDRDPDGRRLAMVKKALIAPLRDRWTVMSPTAQT